MGCAVEYNCVRWGSHDLLPQAGVGVYERGPDGLLAAARVYNDIEPPAGVPRIRRATDSTGRGVDSVDMKLEVAVIPVTELPT